MIATIFRRFISCFSYFDIEPVLRLRIHLRDHLKWSCLQFPTTGTSSIKFFTIRDFLQKVNVACACSIKISRIDRGLDRREGEMS